MSVVEVPEAVLKSSGIAPKYYDKTLKLLKDKHFDEQYRMLCRYTDKFRRALGRGIGVTLFGEPNEIRASALYGVAKAVVAQGHSVLVISLDDIVQATSEKAPLAAKVNTVDLLVIPEMAMPDAVINSYFKSIVFKTLKKRIESGKPVVVATELELDHPEYSVESLYPRISRFLIESTLLVDFSEGNACKWLSDGHAMTLASLVDLHDDETSDETKEVEKVVHKKKRLRIKIGKKGVKRGKAS